MNIHSQPMQIMCNTYHLFMYATCAELYKRYKLLLKTINVCTIKLYLQCTRNNCLFFTKQFTKLSSQYLLLALSMYTIANVTPTRTMLARCNTMPLQCLQCPTSWHFESACGPVPGLPYSIQCMFKQLIRSSCFPRRDRLHDYYTILSWLR